MRYYYAQIDSESRCRSILDTHSPIEADDMIAIPSADDSYLGRLWDAETETWSD